MIGKIIIFCWGIFVVPLAVSATTVPLEMSMYGFECFDGIDNDLDGLIDFPADTDCIAQNDDTESEPVPEPDESEESTLEETSPTRSSTNKNSIPSDDVVHIEIESLPIPHGTNVDARPVLLPPDDIGVTFNPQPIPSRVVDTPDPPTQSSATSSDRAINASSNRSSTTARRRAEEKFIQPLLPALEVHMNPGILMGSHTDLDGNILARNVPIHSPHSPFLPPFVALGTVISALSALRIVFIFA